MDNTACKLYRTTVAFFRAGEKNSKCQLHVHSSFLKSVEGRYQILLLLVSFKKTDSLDPVLRNDSRYGMSRCRRKQNYVSVMRLSLVGVTVSWLIVKVVESIVTITKVFVEATSWHIFHIKAKTSLTFPHSPLINSKQSRLPSIAKDPNWKQHTYHTSTSPIGLGKTITGWRIKNIENGAERKEEQMLAKDANASQCYFIFARGAALAKNKLTICHSSFPLRHTIDP